MSVLLAIETATGWVWFAFTCLVSLISSHFVAVTLKGIRARTERFDIDLSWDEIKEIRQVSDVGPVFETRDGKTYAIGQDYDAAAMERFVLAAYAAWARSVPPKRFRVVGVHSETGADVSQYVEADSATGARVKAELKGIKVRTVEPVSEIEEAGPDAETNA